MANNCYYEMHVSGERKAVHEFVRAMKWMGEYAEQGVGRVYSCDKFDIDDGQGDGYAIGLSGDCAWSILSAMRDDSNPNNIQKLSERLGLEIEAYSSEYGIGFEEHVYINKGDVEVNECVDAYEVCVDDIDDETFNSDEFKKKGITKDNYMDYEEDGWIQVGGFDDWEFFFVD